jgi:hypothetical protein
MAIVVLLIRIKTSAMKCLECNCQCKEADQAKPPGKSPHQGREIIAIISLENGAFCTVFSENFHKF